MTADLVSFLRARLTEHEEVARAATRYWSGVRIESATEAEAEHIARHDPAAVLADVAAKRAILDRYAEHIDYDDPENSYDHATGRICGLGEAVRLLALPFAGHEDYQEGWAP